MVNDGGIIFDASLHCDESEVVWVIDTIYAAFHPAELESSSPKDNISLVSATSASHGSAALTSVHWSFWRVIVMGSVWFPLPSLAYPQASKPSL